MAQFKLILEMSDGTMRDWLVVHLPDYHGRSLMHFHTQDGRNVTVNLDFVKTVTAIEVDRLPGGTA